MSVNGMVEKKAMTDAERAEYIKAAVLSAVGAAGIGAIIRSRKANKARKKDGNPETARNAIVVPIKKSKFMEGLPTPKELAESRGEQLGQEAAPGAEPAALSAPAETGSTGTSGAEALTSEQIAAKKKEILGNGRKFNFFGKRAAAKTAQEEADKEKKDEKPAEEKKDKKEDDGRHLFRDQDGRFVSPTDPVAAEQAEKDAFDLFGIGELAKKNFNAMFDKPVMFTAGALGSIYLAAKISDAINERRRAKAKERLENAREEYVGLLEGSEKKADDWSTIPGEVIGTAFFVPAALTALVASKIIENRKIDKKKQKEMSDSYPDEPIILYKTSEAKEIPIAPETALALFLVKRAMIENIERESLMSKCAQQGLPAQVSGYGQLGGVIKDSWNSLNSANQDTAMDDAFEFLKDDKNEDLVLDLVKSYGPDGTSNQRNAARDAIGSRIGTFNNWWKGNDKFWKDKEFQTKLISDPRMSNLLATRFNNNDKYIAYRNQLIDSELGKTFRQGGILHDIVSWILKNTGIGAYMFNNRLENRLASFGSSNSGQITTPDAKPTAGQPAATAQVG